MKHLRFSIQIEYIIFLLLIFCCPIKHFKTSFKLLFIRIKLMYLRCIHHTIFRHTLVDSLSKIQSKFHFLQQKCYQRLRNRCINRSTKVMAIQQLPPRKMACPPVLISLMMSVFNPIADIAITIQNLERILK